MKQAVVLLAMILGSGCAHAGLMDYARGQLCNENSAYAKGMNDAREDKAMNPGVFSICEEATREAFQKSYRDGFTAGLQARAADKPAAPQTQIVIGGSSVAANPKQAYCELHPFTSTFSAWGASRFEAQMNVKEKCLKKYDKMFCEDYDCKEAD